jgi:hypothetical protein
MSATSKYGNKRTVVDGIPFQSKAEARRYGELRLLEQAGEIRELTCQHPINLDAPVRGEGLCLGYFEGQIKCIGYYYCDFYYVECATGREVYEDVKSPATQKNPVYRLKKKWAEVEWGIQITEIEA